MELTIVTKVTISDKPKYFKTLLEASFFIETHYPNTNKLEIENCPALTRDSKYYLIFNVTHECDNVVKQLASNQIHSIFVNSISNNDDRDEYTSSTYRTEINMEKKSYSGTKSELFITDNKKYFLLEKEVNIEPTPAVYQNLYKHISEAISTEKDKFSTEKQQRYKLFEDKKEKLQRKQNKLKKLEVELAKLDTECKEFKSTMEINF